MVETWRAVREVPDYISYLHSLAANGFGDKYAVVENGDTVVDVKICYADQFREESLAQAVSVSLRYGKRSGILPDLF